MSHVRTRRTFSLLLVALLGALTACGGAGDGRDRNVEMIVGTACKTAGETKTVSKAVNVCGLSGKILIWYPATSRKPKGEKCSRPGAYRATPGKRFVCGVYKKQRMWIEVTPMQADVSTTVPVVAEGDASSTESTVAAAPVAPSTSDTGATAPTTTPSVVQAVEDANALNTPQAVQVVPPAEAKVVAAAVPATALKVTSAPKEAKNGQVLTAPIVVQVSTAGGEARKVPGITVSMTTLRADVSLAGQSAVTDANGRATFDGVKVVGPIAQTDVVPLEFTAPDLDAAFTNLTLRPGSAVRLAVVSHGSTAVAGEAFPDVVRVVIADAGDVQVPTAGTEITATDATTNKVLSKATTNDEGEAVFDALKLTKSGTGRLTFSSGDLVGDSITVTVLPATAAGVDIVTPPPSFMQSGIPANNNPTVRLVDQYGNPIEKEGVRVTATLADGWPSPKATLTGGSATTDESGKAVFTDLTLAGYGVTHYTIEFKAGTATVTTVAVVRLDAGLPDAVELVALPDVVRSGSKLEAPIMVRLVDRWKNWISAKGASIVVSTDASVKIEGTSAKTGDNGVATFSDFVVTGDATKVSSLTLTFRSGDLTATERSVDLLSGYAKSLVFLAHQRTLVRGKAFSVQTKVQLVDEAGYPAPDPSTKIFSNCDNTVSGPVDTGTDGTATIFHPSILGLGWIGCDYTFNRVVGGAIMYRVMVFVVPVGSLEVIGYGAVPTSAQNGVGFDNAPYVTVRTATGMIPGLGLDVTARIVEQPGASAVLANATAQTDKNGYAYFPNLTITGIAGRYVLEFAAEGGDGYRTRAIQLSAGPGVGVAITREASDVNSGSTFASMPILQIVDKSGNPTTRAGAKATMTIPGASPAEATPDASGVIAFGTTDAPVARGKAGSITPKFALIDTASNATIAERDGAPYVLHPGHFASAAVSVPRPFNSGTPIPAFDLLDAEGNVIEEPATLWVELGYRPRPGLLVWYSGLRNLQVESGRANFGDTALLHGLSGSEMEITITRLIPGRSVTNRQVISRFNITIAEGPKLGEIGPSGGWIVYKSPSIIDVSTGISKGGHYLELAPAWWESRPTARRFASSMPNAFVTGDAIGDGAANTANLLKTLTDPESAAAIAANLDLDNNLDWFLPSQAEALAINLAGIRWGQGSEGDVTDSTEFWTSTVEFNLRRQVSLLTYLPAPSTFTRYVFRSSEGPVDTSRYLNLMRPVSAFG